MHLNASQSYNLKNTVNISADFFSAQYLDHSTVVLNNQTLTNISISVNINANDISLIDVFNALTKLSSDKGPGPDLIPNSFLKNCRCVLAYLL